MIKFESFKDIIQDDNLNVLSSSQLELNSKSELKNAEIEEYQNSYAQVDSREFFKTYIDFEDDRTWQTFDELKNIFREAESLVLRRYLISIGLSDRTKINSLQESTDEKILKFWNGFHQNCFSDYINTSASSFISTSSLISLSKLNGTMILNYECFVHNKIYGWLTNNKISIETNGNYKDFSFWEIINRVNTSELESKKLLELESNIYDILKKFGLVYYSNSIEGLIDNETLSRYNLYDIIEEMTNKIRVIVKASGEEIIDAKFSEQLRTELIVLVDYITGETESFIFNNMMKKLKSYDTPLLSLRPKLSTEFYKIKKAFLKLDSNDKPKKARLSSKFQTEALKYLELKFRGITISKGIFSPE